MKIILNHAPHKYLAIQPVRIFLQTFIILHVFICFAYQSKLLDCLIKRITITPFTSINGIAELIETKQYKIITSGEPETSNWFYGLKTSSLQGIRRLSDALEQNQLISVGSFDQALNELLLYSLCTINPIIFISVFYHGR